MISSGRIRSFHGLPWLIALGISSAVALAAEMVIQVAPAKNPGGIDILADALARSRNHHLQHPEDRVSLRLPPGRLELRAPLKLTASDSHLRWIGAEGTIPTIMAGSSRIQGWKPNPNKAGLWEVNLPPSWRDEPSFQQLFLNGKRLTRCRFPKNGFLRAAAMIPAEGPIRLPFRTGDLQPEWARDPDVQVVILMKWTDLHLPLRSVDVEHRFAELGGAPRDSWMDEPDARYWVENVRSMLSEPGEWHLDRPAGVLRFIAPPGVDPNRDRVTAPRLASLIEVAGTADNPVRDLEFRNLIFEESDYLMPAAGLRSPQAAVTIPGAVLVHHAVECTFSGCRFENLGGYGLELGRGSQSCTVTRCTFQHLAAGGLRVGDPSDSRTSSGDANHSHLISDNTLEHLGRIFAPGVGILVFHSGTNRIVHNRISDLYYTGISVGWNWGYQDTPCHDNEIAYNVVEKVGQGLLSDMGGVYTLGPQPHTHIHHNLFRDIDSYGYGGWGLYTDEGSTGILLENNVVYRCKDAGFHQHYGRDNVVRNNLIAFNRIHQLMRTRSEAHRSFWFTNNVVIWREGDLLGSNWEGGPEHVVLDGNLYWDTRLGARSGDYLFQNQTWDAWQASGHDKHSQIADPLLRDPLHPEYGFQGGSPTVAFGFRPIELGDVGPRSPRRGEGAR